MGNAILLYIKQYFITTNSISFTHKWTIDNYSRLYDEGHAWKWKICSKQFAPPNNGQFLFELYLYPKGESESWKDYVMICVGVYDMPQIYEGKIRCRWNVSIEDENGYLCGDPEGKKYYCLFSNIGIIEPTFIQYSELLNSSSQYLPNNQLTLYLSIQLQADDCIFNVITINELGTSRFDCAQEVTTLEHIWTIENFVQLFDGGAATPYFIQSDYFPALNKLGERFCLKLCPNGFNAERNSFVDIAIIRNENENRVNVHWKISILDADGEEWGAQEWTEKIDSIHGRYFDYNRASLLDESNGLVVNNKLRIYFEMSYMIDEKHNTTNNTKMLGKVHKSKSSYDVANKAFHHVSHHWTIDKFSNLFLNSPKNHSIDSQIFKTLPDARFKFHLSLWSNGHDEHSKDYPSLYLVNVSLHTNQVKVQYRISLIDANKQKITKCVEQLSIKKYDKTRISNFFHRTRLQDPCFIQKFLSNGKLTIFCELWAIQDRKIYKSKPTNKQSFVNNPSASSPVFNMPNANLQGVIFNVQSALSMNDFNVNTSRTSCCII